MNRTRSRHRIRFLLGVCSILVLHAAQVHATAPSTSTDSPTDSISYEQAREGWERDRMRRLTRKLILQEQVLTGRLQGILEEGQRTGLTDLPLETLLQEEPGHLLSAPQPPAAGAELADRMEYWILRQQEILATKLASSETIRRRLAATAGPGALEEMFRRDLGRAVDAYVAGQYDLAGARFQDILDLYTYQNLDDVRFFRAEAALADGAWDTAVQHYLVLLRTQPGSAYRPQAFRHLIYLRAMFGQHATAVSECDEFAADLEAAGGDVAYLCGRELFLSQRYPEARRVLARVPVKDPALLRARHLDGLCLILENRYEDAIGAFEALLTLSERSAEDARTDQAFREDSQLKLGYLYFEAGRFSQAAEMFEAVAKAGKRHPEALLGQAWSGLSLADHERSLALSRQLVEHFPASPFRYEAMTLAGYASEQLERRDESREWYGKVLEEAERSEALRELAVERRQILVMMRRLVEMEPRVFGEGRSEQFGEYLDLRARSRVLMNRVKYTELQTANRSMDEYIAERREIGNLARQLKGLARRAQAAASPAEQQEVALLDREVRGLMKRIRLSGLMEIQRQPLMIHERTLASVNSMLDSLAMSSTVEFNRLEQRREGLKENGTEAGDFTRALYRERFQRLGGEVEQLRSRAANLKRRPVTSNLPRWSELAFSRLAIGDIDFEELQRIEERLHELDGYLERIDGLLRDGTPTAGAEGVQP
ncbi:MAG: tetratricopeptide repeat protein [Candidatus Delongbacteria bacterium]